MHIDPKARRELYDMLTLPVFAGAAVCLIGLAAMIYLDVWVL